MITIWKKQDEQNWVFIEEMETDGLLIDRLIALRTDGNEYRAENRDGFVSQILEV